MKLFNLILFALAITMLWADDIDLSAWNDAPLGIAITNVVYDTYGVAVKFETDLEPPYIVGVYDSFEDGLARCFPLAEVTTDTKAAFVPGDFTDVTTFVEVMHPSRINPSLPHRVLSASERQRMHEYIKSHPVYQREAKSAFKNQGIVWAPDNVMGKQKEMQLIGDHLWAGFVFSDANELSFGFNTVKAYPVKDLYRRYTQTTKVYEGKTTRPFPLTTYTSTNETCVDVWIPEIHPPAEREYLDGPIYRTRSGRKMMGSVGVTPQDYDRNGFLWRKVVVTYEPTEETRERILCSKFAEENTDLAYLSASKEVMQRGLGWRFVMDDRKIDTHVCRAYSARTNCSQTVYLPRAFVGLSAHDGYRLATDANGRVIIIPDTNEHIIEAK